MARPNKEGLDYFPLDVNIDQDDKVAIIEAQHGVIGFAVIVKLFMRIYNNGYFYNWNEKEQILFSKRVNVDINELNVIVNDCVEWGLFHKELFNKHNILTSRGIQRRYCEIVKRRKCVELIENYVLLNTNELDVYNNIVYVDINPTTTVVNDNINKQSKEKESKEKESKEKESKEKETTNVAIAPSSPSINYNEILTAWNQKSKLPQVKLMTENRKKHLRARLKEHDLSIIYKAIEICSISGFLQGKNDRNWIASFDWVFGNSENFIKVLEGKYLDNDLKNQLSGKSELEILESKNQRDLTIKERARLVELRAEKQHHERQEELRKKLGMSKEEYYL